MFMILGVAVLIGSAVGFASGGNLLRLGEVRLAGKPFAFAALGAMILGSLVDFGEVPDRAVVAAGYLAAAAFIVVNLVRAHGRLRLGLAVLGLGWALNAIVMVPNAGMPLSMEAYAASGQTEVPTPGSGGFFKVVIADERTFLRPLGDVVPLRWSHQVVSLGDLVLMAGVAVIIAAGMGSGARNVPLRAIAGGRAAYPTLTPTRRPTP